jgi:hypothetical protein
VLYLQDLIGAVLDNVGNGVTVGRTEQQCLQDEEIERALQKIGLEWRCAALGHGLAFPKIIDWSIGR